MYPTREEAEKILIEAFEINPGPWKNHCRSAAHCAQKIATACGDMNPDKAYQEPVSQALEEGYEPCKKCF